MSKKKAVRKIKIKIKIDSIMVDDNLADRFSSTIQNFTSENCNLIRGDKVKSGTGFFCENLLEAIILREFLAKKYKCKVGLYDVPWSGWDGPIEYMVLTSKDVFHDR